ncbi:hypothetical protein [Pelagibacterium montanilacus]|uniref:hypothetical protein n=1 Tax=Pelagibacterium montanilacus TaxID=2185280 RepID=UPI000F8DF4EE|nr:hypothetical protein [Pelagibacterium montanilacus]
MSKSGNKIKPESVTKTAKTKTRSAKSQPERKRSTTSMSTLASRAVRGKKLTKTEIASLGGSVLSQDEKKARA